MKLYNLVAPVLAMAVAVGGEAHAEDSVATDPVTCIGAHPDSVNDLLIPGEDGIYQGAVAEEARSFFKVAGIRIQRHTHSFWTRSIADFQAGKVDMLAGVMYQPERFEGNLASDPWISIPHVIIGRKDQLDRLADAGEADLLIGMEKWAQAFPGLYSEISQSNDVAFVNSIPRGLRMVAAGRLDGFLTQLTNLDSERSTLAELDLGYIPAKRVDTRIYFVFSAKGKCADKRDDLNRAMEAWRQEGTGPARLERFLLSLVQPLARQAADRSSD